MPNKLYGRIAQIVIFPQGSQAISIGDDLRFEFVCKKSPSSDPNTAEIKITNLSKKTRDTLDELIDTPLVLSAGYAEGEGLLNVFFGDIMSVKHSETPPDIITTIEVGDGAKSLRDSKTALSFAKNTSVSTVIETLADELGKPVKRPEYLKSVFGKYLSGFAAIGNSKTILDQLARENSFSWSIQNDEIVIITDQDTPPSDILLLSPDTGLVGSPERNNLTIDKKEGSDTSGKPPGWNVTAKLFPQVIPGGFIALQFNQRPGGEIVKIIEVEHSGDTYGDVWTSKIQVQDL